MRTHYCGQIEDSLIGETVSVTGWVHRRRDHGGVIFIDLRDREGLLQVVFDPDRPEIFADAERLRGEYVLAVKGRVRARPAPERVDRAPVAIESASSSVVTVPVPSSNCAFSRQTNSWGSKSLHASRRIHFSVVSPDCSFVTRILTDAGMD